MDDGFRGFLGHGNANAQAVLAPLNAKTPLERQRLAVQAFAADGGCAFKQDAAVFGRVRETWPTPEGRAAGAATIGFDFPLNREPNAEEADDIAATVAREMYSAQELADPRTVTDPDDPRYTPLKNDAGFTIFPSGVVRFLN